jgi:hypothetical protein
MSVEYLVLQAVAEEGAFGRVRAHKLHQSWDTLQEALDELGQQAWDLYTTIYSATKERRGPGEHYCEGFIFKRMAYSAPDASLLQGQASARAPESMRQEASN